MGIIGLFAGNFLLCTYLAVIPARAMIVSAIVSNYKDAHLPSILLLAGNAWGRNLERKG